MVFSLDLDLVLLLYLFALPYDLVLTRSWQVWLLGLSCSWLQYYRHDPNQNKTVEMNEWLNEITYPLSNIVYVMFVWNTNRANSSGRTLYKPCLRWGASECCEQCLSRYVADLYGHWPFIQTDKWKCVIQAGHMQFTASYFRIHLGCFTGFCIFW